MTVTLTLEEANMAAAVGLSRHEDSYGTRKDTYKDRPAHEDLEVHVLGALAEMAFGKFANLHWDPSLGEFHGKRADFEPDIEVKASDKYPNLPIKPRDAKNPETRTRRYVMVQRTGDFTFEVVGWLTPSEAYDATLRIPFHQHAGIRYFTPDNLHPMSEFVEIDYPRSAWDADA